MNHALILPVLLPAVVGALLVLAARHDRVLARVFGVEACELHGAAMHDGPAEQGERFKGDRSPLRRLPERLGDLAFS